MLKYFTWMIIGKQVARPESYKEANRPARMVYFQLTDSVCHPLLQNHVHIRQALCLNQSGNQHKDCLPYPLRLEGFPANTDLQHTAGNQVLAFHDQFENYL